LLHFGLQRMGLVTPCNDQDKRRQITSNSARDLATVRFIDLLDRSRSPTPDRHRQLYSLQYQRLHPFQSHPSCTQETSSLVEGIPLPHIYVGLNPGSLLYSSGVKILPVLTSVTIKLISTSESGVILGVR